MSESEKEWYDRLEAEIIDEIESDPQIKETQFMWLMSKGLRRLLIKIISWTAVRVYEKNRLTQLGHDTSDFHPIRKEKKE